MNLRDLEYLIALEDHRHFGKASRACFVSQPTLSIQIKKLEEELEVQLIERSNKNIFFTEIGQKVVKKARDVIWEAAQIELMSKQSLKNAEVELKLGLFPTLAPYLLPRILPPVTAEFPQVRFLLLERKSEDLLDQVIKGEIDAVFLVLPVVGKSLEVTTLFEEPFLLAVNQNHPFAKQRKIDQEILKGETLLLLEEGHCLRDQALELCTSIGASEMDQFKATSLETLRQMVEIGIGITLIPELAVPSKESIHGIRYIPFNHPVPSRSIAICWRKSSAKKEVLEKMALFIQQINL